MPSFKKMEYSDKLTSTTWYPPPAHPWPTTSTCGWCADWLMGAKCDPQWSESWCPHTSEQSPSPEATNAHESANPHCVNSCPAQRSESAFRGIVTSELNGDYILSKRLLQNPNSLPYLGIH